MLERLSPILAPIAAMSSFRGKRADMRIGWDDGFRPICCRANRAVRCPIADHHFLIDDGRMRALLPLMLLAIPTAPVDHPHTYLLSIGDIPLKDTQSIEAFSLDTWGVEFDSVCHIPGGWRIKAGSSATPNGELSGEGSQGATWFDTESPKELRNFVLVTLYDRVQRNDVRSADGNGLVPATFKGNATIETDDGDLKLALTYKNVTLVPARRCPAS